MAEKQKFVVEEEFEVWGINAAGHRRPMGAYVFHNQKVAEDARDEWQKESDARQRLESLGPVKPSPTRYFVVRKTVTREEI